MVRYKRQKLKVLKFLDSNFRNEPFYASYVASEVKVNSMRIARMMLVLRAHGMVEITPVKSKSGNKVYLYRLTDEFSMEKSMKLFE
jgi:predicted transcriptional regulator